jgi:hypothetical protein
LEEAIELAVHNYYPNLHAVFRVLLTMPVGSVPYERSFFCYETLETLEQIYNDRRSTCWTG